MRRAGALVDRTQLKNPNVKLNWQATQEGHGQLPLLRRLQDQGRPQPRHGGILFDAPTATFHQDNAYTDNPLHGLWKIADDRVINSNMFLSAKYAYYNTGFMLDPVGGLNMQAGRSFTTAQSYGSVTRASTSVRRRPSTSTSTASSTRDRRQRTTSSTASAFARVDATSGTLWPGNGILALRELADRPARAGVPPGQRRQPGDLSRLLRRRHDLARTALTIDLGLRYDQQWRQGAGERRRWRTRRSRTSCPASSFAGYDAPFTWKNFSPRAGVTYALDEARKTVARASFSRYAGQLETGTVGVTEPELDRRLGDLPLDRSERRPLRAGQRGAARSVHHRGRRLQPGEPDRGDVGERARPGPRRRR